MSAQNNRSLPKMGYAMISPTKQTSRAFTLIEVLIVTVIISIAAAITFPVLNAMIKSATDGSGANTISLVAKITHNYATIDIQFAEDAYPNPHNKFVETGFYSGAAAIFTPNNRIYLAESSASVRSNQTMGQPGGPHPNVRSLALRGPDKNTYHVNNISANNKVRMRRLTGFEDIDIDFISLSSNLGVCGIITHGASPTVYERPLLIAPPFAIWYDQNGILRTTYKTTSPTSGTDYDYTFVYYDGNNNNDIEFDRERDLSSTSYSPYKYNRLDEDFVPSNWNTSKKRMYLPFEKFEAVYGVIVYNKNDFREAAERGTFADWGTVPNSNTVNNNRWDWLKNNGQILLFSKQSGNLIRSDDE